jgi:hypothetical protein
VDFEGLDFEYFFLQPCGGVEGSVERAVEFCMQHPKWRLGLQAHKMAGFE